MKANPWQGVRFDDDEYTTRLVRMRTAMARSGLDAVVVSDDRLFWYFTGFGDITPIGSTARPRVLVLPAESAPVLYVHQSTVRCVREMSVFSDVRGYGELGRAPIEAIAELLQERQPERVGAELGGQLRPTASYSDLRELERQIGSLVDCSAALWTVRMVKTPAESARIRTACEITSAAYAAAFPRFRPGMSERAASALLRSEVAAAGGDGGWAWVSSGHAQYDRIDGVIRDRTFDPGDLVFVDMGACVGGYWADFSRTCVLGRTNSRQTRLQQLVQEATTAGVDAIKAGAKASEIARAIEQAMTTRGLTFSSRAERYGHGLGIAVTEPPDIWPTDQTPISVGMVLTVEPGTWTEEGLFHCEQNVLVTEDGHEVLSLSPTEIYEVL